MTKTIGGGGGDGGVPVSHVSCFCRLSLPRVVSGVGLRHCISCAYLVSWNTFYGAEMSGTWGFGMTLWPSAILFDGVNCIDNLRSKIHGSSGGLDRCPAWLGQVEPAANNIQPSRSSPSQEDCFFLPTDHASAFVIDSENYRVGVETGVRSPLLASCMPRPAPQYY